MAYCTRSDIEQRFGADSVADFADLDEQTNTTTMTSRINYAIDVAEAEVDSIMRCSPYAVPIVGIDTTTPVLLTHICATLAGVYLYTARGVQNYDPATGRGVHSYEFHRQDALTLLRALADGTRKLNAK